MSEREGQQQTVSIEVAEWKGRGRDRDAVIFNALLSTNRETNMIRARRGGGKTDDL